VARKKFETTFKASSFIGRPEKLDTGHVRVDPKEALQVAHLSPNPDRAQEYVFRNMLDGEITLPGLVAALYGAHSL
jgi:hypothetical protein